MASTTDPAPAQRVPVSVIESSWLAAGPKAARPCRSLSRATLSSVLTTADSNVRSQTPLMFTIASASSQSRPSSALHARPSCVNSNTCGARCEFMSYEQTVSRLRDQNERLRRDAETSWSNDGSARSSWKEIEGSTVEKNQSSHGAGRKAGTSISDYRRSGSLDSGTTEGGNVSADPTKGRKQDLPSTDLVDVGSPIETEVPHVPRPLVGSQVPNLPRDVVQTPEKVWHGNSRAPAPHATTYDEEIGVVEAQAAVPLQALPPASRFTGQTNPHQTSGNRPATPQRFNTTQMIPRVRKVDVDGSQRRRARRKILAHKHLMQITQISLNGLCIFATWWWPHYYYILLPLITATVALNCIMVASIVINRIWRLIIPEKIIMPKTPNTLVMLVPCYNETEEELVKSLDSLTTQDGIVDHHCAILVVCDGKVRGPGMKKTTADYLLHDILTHKTERKYISSAYTAWDQAPMDIVVQHGLHQGIPYYCIIKQQNQGKRDGLIIARSFLYNFNRRTQAPDTIFSPGFFDHMAAFLINGASIDNVGHIVGMDADTIFDKKCISQLLEQSRYPNTVGVCGFVAVDWKGSNWNLWRLYQSAEYTVAQGLRRLHQSLVTHKVSCLPGCCQLLRICEETCGDHVLLELFGYCPEVDDSLLTQIRATASEDRNHVCHMLSARPQSQTRQALFAKAYTDVPGSWSVFLSQRRRWTLGASSNDLMLVSARGVQWFERILAFVNVLTWILNPFIFASIAAFILAITNVPYWIILAFVSVMLVPVIYYLLIPVWLCETWRQSVQFWAGLFMYVFCGPFINIVVLLYASVYMDSFGWGKTRVVMAETSSSTSGIELERSQISSETTERATGGLPCNEMLGAALGTQRSRVTDIGEDESNFGPRSLIDAVRMPGTGGEPVTT